MSINNQLGSSNQDIQYKDDLVNGGSQAPVDATNRVHEPLSNLNEDIVKNMVVEKDLSEIASAYNIHRTESDGNTEDLLMEVDTPTDLKDASTFGSDKSDHLSEVTDMDSQDAPEDTSQQAKETEIIPTESLKNKDQCNQEGEQLEKTDKENTDKNTEDSSQDVEGNSKDTEETSKDFESNMDTTEDSKDAEGINARSGTDDNQNAERSKVLEDNVQDANENSQEATVNHAESIGNSQDSKANHAESTEDSQDTSIKNQDSNENSQDVTNEENSQNGEESSQDVKNKEKEAEGEKEEHEGVKSRIKIKQEVQSEEDEEPFVEGVCSICHGEMDTTDHITMSKHLSESHVIADDNDITCGVCHKEYQERRSAIRHILNMHLNYKPHKCGQCSKSFARKDHLSRHERLHDPETFECKFCNGEFESQAKLDRHFRDEHSTETKKRKSRGVTYEEIDSDAIEESEEEQQESDQETDANSSDSDGDGDAFCRSWKRKSKRTRKTAASKRPTRGRGRPKKVPPPVEIKREPRPLKVSKAQQKKLDREREEQRKKRDQEARKREILRRKKEKERMREEERALERLREKERMRELREAKERQIKEEMKKRAEELARKQKEEEEHYFDGNYWEAAKHSLKDWSNGPDDFSVNYTNFYGGNCHEPPKKTLSQLDLEKKLLQETLAGSHFLTASNDSTGVHIKSENVSINPDASPGICGLCGQEYDDTEPQALSKHIYDKHQSQGSDFDRKCPVCGKEYSERKGLNRHILHYHLNYKPHQCTFCLKHFSRRDHLTRHLDSHTDEKNKHICEFCQKTFTRREHLNRHLWVHKDTFKFRCEYCTKAYTKEEHLSRHVKEAHYSRTFSTEDTYTSATLL